MMPWTQRLPVGCDFGHSAVKLVQLKRRGGTWSVVRAELRELTPEARADDEWPNRQAMQVASACGWAQREHMTVSVQGRPPLVRHLTVPPMPKRELKEALQWEAKKASSLAVEDLVVDYVNGPEVTTDQGRMMPVTLVVAERGVVESEFARYRAAGLRITVMDVNPLAFYYAAHRLNRDETGPGCVAFVDIGASRMDINVAKHGSLRFSRSVALGGETLTESLARALGIDPSQAEGVKREHGLSGKPKVVEALAPEVDRLVVEIQRSVDYYRAQSHDGPLEALWVGGGAALTPGFVEYLAKFFDAKVGLFDPFEGMDCQGVQSEVQAAAPRFIAGVGLALAGLA
ncbi:MAG: type IV pilus assembly protein PilM [Nitrospirota bacterium]